MQGLRHARAEHIPAGVTVVVTRSNFRHLVEIARVAHAAGAAAVHFAPVEPFGRASRDHARLVPSAELVAPHLQRAVAGGGARRPGRPGADRGDGPAGRAHPVFSPASARWSLPPRAASG